MIPRLPKKSLKNICTNVQGFRILSHCSSRLWGHLDYFHNSCKRFLSLPENLKQREIGRCHLPALATAPLPSKCGATYMSSKREWKICTGFLLLYHKMRRCQLENSEQLGIHNEFKWKWMGRLQFVMEAALTYRIPGTRLP